MIMKKISILLASIATLSLVACQVVETESVEDEKEVVNLTTITANANEAETKAYVDGLQVKWNASDVIVVADEDDDVVDFTLTAGENTKTGTFSGDLGGKALGTYAIYPKSTNVDISGTDATFDYLGGWSYGKSEVPMYGVNDGAGTYTFHNIGGAIRVSYANVTNVAKKFKITETHTGGEAKPIAGLAMISDLDSSPTVDYSGLDDSDVIISDIVPDDNDVTVVIPIPSGSGYNFRVELLDVAENSISSSVKTASNITITADKLKPFPTIGLTQSFERITSLSDLESGQYVIVGEKTPTSFGLFTYGTPDGSGRLAYSAAYSSLPSSIETNALASIWKLIVSGTGASRTVKIYDKDNKEYLACDGALSFEDEGSETDFTVTASSDLFVFKAGDNYLGPNKSANYWRDYASGNVQQTNCIALYKLEEPSPLVSIAIDPSSTHQTEFFKDASFSYEGLVVKATYANAKIKTVVPTLVSTPDMSTVANDVEVTVTYTEYGITKSTTYTIDIITPVKYTVTLGDDSSTITQSTAGASIDLPSRSDVGDYEFQGWTTSNITVATETRPSTLIEAGSYTPTSDITLYPVYLLPGTPTWDITTTLRTGKTYVFGAVKAAASSTLKNDTAFGAVAFAQDYNASSPTWGARVDLTPNASGQVANASVTDACKWVLQSVSEGCYVFKKSTKYLYLNDAAGSSSAAQCGLHTSGRAYLENVSATCKDAFLMHPTSSSTKVMLYNTSNGYRMYNSRTYSNTMTPYVRFYEMTQHGDYISTPPTP